MLVDSLLGLQSCFFLMVFLIEVEIFIGILDDNKLFLRLYRHLELKERPISCNSLLQEAES